MNIFRVPLIHLLSVYRYIANGTFGTLHGGVTTPCNRLHYYASLCLALERPKRTLHDAQPRILG